MPNRQLEFILQNTAIVAIYFLGAASGLPVAVVMLLQVVSGAP